MDEAALYMVNQWGECYKIRYSIRHGGTPGHVRTLQPLAMQRDSFLFQTQNSQIFPWIKYCRSGADQVQIQETNPLKPGIR